MRELKKRQNVIKGIFLSISLILILKLFYIQIIKSEYRFSAQENAILFEPQEAARGLIFDRNNKLLVSNKASYDLIVIPREVQSFDTLKLCDICEITIDEFRESLRSAKKYSEWKETVFIKQLNNTSAYEIKERLNEFPGFYIRRSTTRDYLVKTASHTIGYLGQVNLEQIKNHKYYTKGDLIGVTGIEGAYDTILRGRKGMKMTLVDVHNRNQGSFQDGAFDTSAINGKNIICTIDSDLQIYGEKLMRNKMGAIVAIEPHSGEILCLITSPNYTLDEMNGRKRSKNYAKLIKNPNNPLLNRALSSRYPPASSFKLINSLISLQEKTLYKESSYYCNQGYEYGNKKIMKCHEHISPVNLETAIATSCNSYFCNMFEDLFKKYSSTSEAYNVWRRHTMSFGLGDYLNTDFISGNKGYVPKTKYYDQYYGINRWKSSTILSMSIGQGEISVTPIQMANFTSIIANRGFYYTPHIIKSIQDGNIPERFKKKHFASIEEKYFTPIIDGMQQVVYNEHGTAFNSKIEHIEICGKTGTAQNPHGADHSIFIAFAPKNNPKIAIAVYIENGTWGEKWAAPISSLMIEKYITKEVKNKLLESRMINGSLLSVQ